MTETHTARKRLLRAAAIGLAGLASPLQAQVALCAAEQAISCTPFETCDRSLPGAVNLPILMKIDIGKSEIVSDPGTDAQRSSRIASFAETETAQLLHGADEDRPWVLQVDKATGRFTGTIAGTSEAFVLFGECSWEMMQ